MVYLPWTGPVRSPQSQRWGPSYVLRAGPVWRSQRVKVVGALQAEGRLLAGARPCLNTLRDLPEMLGATPQLHPEEQVCSGKQAPLPQPERLSSGSPCQDQKRWDMEQEVWTERPRARARGSRRASLLLEPQFLLKSMVFHFTKCLCLHVLTTILSFGGWPGNVGTSACDPKGEGEHKTQ